MQQRFAVKDGQLRIDAGGEWLARGDYYVSPGVQATAAWWWREQWAAEVSGAWYFSGMNAAARDLRARTGRVPDSRRPQGVARLGLRMQAAGLSVNYLKPVSTQPHEVGGRIIDEDADFVRRTLGLETPPWELSPVVITSELLAEVMAGRSW